MTASDAGDTRKGPLDGIRVVEYAIWHAGPGADAILADLGAQVIKIESLEGDPERSQATLGTADFRGVAEEGWSFLFEFSNRNKKGICLDIATPKGREIFERLIQDADLFLTNLRKSTKTRLGIDYESIRRINPGIVHANVSGFGPEGPMSDIGAFDPMGQAISGMAFLTGPDEPVLLQSLILDQMAAITASHAILTALLARERQGVGQEVHVSLYSSAIWLMHSNLLATGMLGHAMQMGWDRYQNSPLRNSFRCSDGKWLMGTNHPEQKYWSRFCSATGQKELEHDPRYATAEARMQHVADLVRHFEQIFASRERDEWLRVLHADGLMFAPVQTYEEVYRDPQARANGYVVDFPHRSLGTISMPGYPARFSAHSAGTHAAAPRLGEHTDEVLEQMGLSAAEIEDLRRGNVIG